MNFFFFLFQLMDALEHLLINYKETFDTTFIENIKSCQKN